MSPTLALLALLFAPSSITARPASASAQPAPSAGALQTGGTHKDQRFGFELKPPRGWESIALKTDEAWLAAKYLSNKTYYYTDPDTKWTSGHRPELMVIAFIHENMRREREESEETQDGVTTKTIKIHNPFKDYEDYLDRTYAGGGFYVDEKERARHGNLDVTKYSIKVEKLTRNGPKRIVTWIFHAPDIDFAVQVEVLEGEYKKLSRLIDPSLKSFGLIERTEGELPASGRTDEFGWITIRQMEEGTPEERRSRRMESERQLHQRAIEQLPADWDHHEVGGILVLSHTDAKYAQRVGKHAQLVLKWLDDTFPHVGEGEYVRQPILRVCKDQEEEGSFSRGVRGGDAWWVTGSEITTHKDDTGFIGWEMSWVNGRLFHHWFQDRDRDLWSAMPEWLRGGLSIYVGEARGDGSKLNFRGDGWNRDETRLAVSQGRATAPRQLVQMTRSEIWGSPGEVFWSYQQQAGMLVRFLMSKEARKVSQARDLIDDYVKALSAVIQERKQQQGPESEAAKPPETEEEEEQRAKERAERWRKQEEELLKTVFGRVFGDWSGSDWERLEKAYVDFVK